MDPRQIALVRDSFDRIDPTAGFGATVYARVAALAPDTRPLFRTEPGGRDDPLYAALVRVVAALDRPEPIFDMLDALARRHRDYGVVERHYLAFGAALVWSLERALGEAFTPAVRRAWQEAYGLVSTRMIAAARRATG